MNIAALKRHANRTGVGLVRSRIIFMSRPRDARCIFRTPTRGGFRRRQRPGAAPVKNPSNAPLRSCGIARRRESGVRGSAPGSMEANRSITKFDQNLINRRFHYHGQVGIAGAARPAVEMNPARERLVLSQTSDADEKRPCSCKLRKDARSKVPKPAGSRARARSLQRLISPEIPLLARVLEPGPAFAVYVLARWVSDVPPRWVR